MSQDDAFNLIHNTKEWNLLKFSEKKTAFHSYIQDLKLQVYSEIVIICSLQL
jgi:hypothetical protein